MTKDEKNKLLGVDDETYAKAQKEFQASDEVNKWESQKADALSNLGALTSKENIISKDVINNINKNFVTPSEVTKADSYLSEQLKKIQSGKTSYSDQVRNMVDKIMNREKFSYDVDTDPLFQQALASAMNSGKQAMQDTIGQASALTGGYGSTYATTAGNQAYNSFIEDAYDNLPQYYQLALEAYQMEGDDMFRQYGMLSDEDAKEFDRYLTAYDATYQQRNRIYDEAYNQFRDNKSDAFAMANLQLSEHGQRVSDAYNYYNATADYSNTLYEREYNAWADSIENAWREIELLNENAWSEKNFDESVRQYEQTFAENVRQYEQNFAEDVRQFEKQLETTISENQKNREHTSSENQLNREHDSSENKLNREHDSTENQLNREHTSSENQLNREHDSTENKLNREHTSSENEKDRNLTVSENEKDRNLTVSENQKDRTHASFENQKDRDLTVSENQKDRDLTVSENQKDRDLALAKGSGGGGGSGGGSGGSGKLKEPTQKQMSDALEAYNTDGMNGLNKYLNSVPSTYDRDSIASYVGQYGELPYSQRTYTVTDDGGVNWGWGVDNNAKVKDEYGNEYTLKQLEKLDKDIAKELSKSKYTTGTTYTKK